MPEPRDLFDAIRNGDVAYLEAHKDDAKTARTEDGSTALHASAESGLPGCARVVIEVCAKVKNNNGQTAFMVATQNDHPGCVAVIAKEEHGMTDNSGKTALMLSLGTIGQLTYDVLARYPDEVKRLLPE